MYRNTYAASSSAGPPPPPPPPDYAYDRQDRPPPPPPPTDSPSRQHDRYPQDRRERDRNQYQFRGPFSDLRRNRPDDRYRQNGEYRDRDRERDRDRDNYRPPQGDFTFRVEPPPGLDSYNSYRPREREQFGPALYGTYRPQPRTHRTHVGSSYDDQAPPHRSRGENERSNARDNRPRRNDDRRRQQHSQQYPRGGHRGRGNKIPTSSRLLLFKKHDDNPELMLGDTTGRTTYRDIDELSDSDEAEMDISDNSDDDVAEPAAKRARTSNTKPEQEIPRWSNPDPYTALPPSDDATRKKKDMVHLIRKARVEAEAKKPMAQTEGLDFISCDLDDDEGGDDAEYYEKPIPKAGAALTNLAHDPPPPVPSTSATIIEGSKENPIAISPSTSLGNRKRTNDDKIKLPHTSLSSSKKMATSGGILPIWQPRDGDNPCPWVEIDHSATPSMGTRLHKEVMDFYLWVRPRDFEVHVRNVMIKNLRKLIKKKWPDADIYPFGSFMSGLYLPTADMDVAICSSNFIKTGYPKYDKSRSLWQLKSHLLVYRVACRNEVDVISKAKVPLVKYTDEETRLKVDISFEKMDGHNAVQTFLDWKKKYPAMPILVAVIKHFLLMRGLNEPVNGGIGGFSVICMVVCLLDQMPQVQSGSMIPEHHLGETLMEFFDYYGNHFDYKTVALRTNPPGLVPKSEVSTVVYRNMDRLSIIDPNNSKNDISGGSKETPFILSQFSGAYSTLKARMAELATDKTAKSSVIDGTILGSLFAGDYSSFVSQRRFLERLSKHGVPEYRPASYNRNDQW
ncbi:hypothetical protein M426DRAFT_6913 [Hypoxylon sp. CI-4A]|nr:hypothetical protein M426DRAFT_6913 [Hypoxylon sp. CI-4A]